MRYALALLALSFSSTTLSAGTITLSLDAGGTDLSTLKVGDTVSINVNLSGLMTGQSLSALGGTVEMTPELSVDTFSLAPGILFASGPDPFELFLDTPGGNVDAEFFQVFGDPIATDGQFFTFDITAVSTGSGQITFEDFSPFASDTNFNFVDVATNTLDYTVSQAGNVVPEPASLFCFVGIALLGLPRRQRSPN
ncbi:hypothetical protein [Stieleria mannarensis]|uniref:hypothetical protein n=1 Tax=Stieleria mannarensis TaxID=2755585 RepID=UPI001602A7B5|nr:hypothetical protein [Rhodopirellula sp. JC639]